ncbi:hypothetical protein [Paludisphaera borealis]|uniref:Major facilitator superfamily (MFS) profile domain-containing protein n=1 Tax=Paludisphaera borealis TaxID=1387353 RepID=A0A1U7CS83_9BACT|nr:hypothetical protein [Paludisphaera borealis]APW61733.1 hypothetical protein BSF38_03261 [Paludisphaera borealis]
MDASKIPPSPASFPIDLSAGRKARIAVFSLFALDGIAFGSWAAYLPVCKARLGLSDGQLGVVLFALVVGSLVLMPATGRALARWSSRTIVLLGAAACCVTIPLVTVAAIASVSTVGCLGFLIGPPLIGAASQSVGLASALLLVVLFGLTIAASARLVEDRPDPESPSSKEKNLEERIPHVHPEPIV